MVCGEWCPVCGSPIIVVTRGIPSMGRCQNGHSTDRRDVLRREPKAETKETKMTNPIDTSPEAIAALIARYTRAFGLASEAYDKGYRNAVKEMAAEIARLTAERDSALVRAERSERAERAAHDAANTAIRQRDEARAWTSVAYEAAANLVLGLPMTDGVADVLAENMADDIRALTPADATAALAARDAAMRNEGRRQAAAVKYDKKYGKDWLGMTCAILATLEPEGGE